MYREKSWKHECFLLFNSQKIVSKNSICLYFLCPVGQKQNLIDQMKYAYVFIFRKISIRVDMISEKNSIFRFRTKIHLRKRKFKINLKLKFQIRQEDMFPDNLIVKLHVFYVLQKKISEIYINSRNDDFLK